MNNTNNKDWNYKFVRYFLNNKQLTVLLFLVILLGGLFGFSQLRTEGFPEVEIPLIVINTVVPGAGPEIIVDTVTLPIENALADIDDIEEMSSTSQNNVSTILVMLEAGADIVTVAQDIRSELSPLILPTSALEPNVFVPEIGGSTFIIAVTGSIYIGDLLEESRVIEDELISLDGVQSVELMSDIDRKIYIDLDLRYQTLDVVDQIKAANISFPLGQTLIDGMQVSLAGKSEVNSIEDIRNIPIVINSPFGTVVKKLNDIASIYESLDYNNQIHRVGFQDLDTGEFSIEAGILYDVRAKSNLDIIEVDKEIKERLEDTRIKYPDLEFVSVFNQAEQSKMQIDELKQGAFGAKLNTDSGFDFLGYIFGGIWLLTIVMLLFVDWKSAVLSLITIPLVFLFTFGILWMLGVQLNTIVLFSLVLVLGLVIDPAIVVLESIKRYTEIGFEGKDAALRAASAVGRGVFIAVFTSFVVFVPFGVVSGMFGEIIKFIPITVIPALAASYFIPMFFLTWMGAKFFKSSSNGLKDDNDIANLWRIARGFVYMSRGILRRTWLQVVIIVLGFAIPILIAGGLFASGKIQQVQFSQPDDITFLTLSVPLEPNITNSQRFATALQVEDIVLQEGENFKAMFYGSMNQSSGSDALSMVFELVPLIDRDFKSSEIADRIEEDLVPLFGENARVAETGAGPPEGDYPVSVEIFNNNPELLKSASILIVEQLKTFEKVVAVKYDGDRTTTELTVKLNEDLVAERGLTPPAVYGQIAGILGEKDLFEIDSFEVVLRVPPSSLPGSFDELENLTVFGSLGPVRVGDIGVISEEEVAGAISHINGERYVSVLARVQDTRDAITVQREIDDWAKNNVEMLGLTERDLQDRRGLDQFEQSFRDLYLAIIFAVVITYIIFVLFFKSFAQPFVILFGILFILVGSLPALVVFARGQFGFLEVLGIIILIGVVENVAIFLIDFANQRVERGMDKKEAIALSSGIRFRPIFLTQLTSMAGLLPLAVFSPFWRGLAVVVIAGIITSGILSLFTTPVLYNWFTRKKTVEEEQPLSTTLRFT
ncbi:MAG: efflux RND transporter permease subunit [Parcubacteria group bacterium]